MRQAEETIMNSTRPSAPFRGIIPPLITPLYGRDTLDVPGLESLIDYVVAGGVDGLFVLGTTGEGASLSYPLRYEVAQRACEFADGRVPVLVGITDTSIVESLRAAEKAARAGAAAVVAAPPYYLPLSQGELVRYFDVLSKDLPLPLLLYNIPSCTQTSLEPDTVLQCSCLPGVIGLKDSSGDFQNFCAIKSLLQDRADFSIFIGPEQLLGRAISAGASGGVCGGANFHPRLYRELYEAARAGKSQDVHRLQATVIGIVSTIYAASPHDSRVIKGIKCALSCLGICDDLPAEPLERYGNAEREKIHEYLASLGLPVSASRSNRADSEDLNRT